MRYSIIYYRPIPGGSVTGTYFFKTEFELKTFKIAHPEFVFEGNFVLNSYGL